ncbi:protein kinase domain-containing protein [Streptomyces cinnamoneus]|uniref:protein kinase domain-containing protein n=1 Tax=Streptomyces cinnamoneus TaxID=53446 RepID=UPI0030B8FFFE
MLHRDVKPGNVLLGHDGRVVLTDFGIAHSTGTSTLTKTGEMVGSIDYIAPSGSRAPSPAPPPTCGRWAPRSTRRWRAGRRSARTPPSRPRTPSPWTRLSPRATPAR